MFGNPYQVYITGLRQKRPMVDDGEYQPNSGWVCPKCSRVWSPEVEECWQCNDKLSLEDNEE